MKIVPNEKAINNLVCARGADDCPLLNEITELRFQVTSLVEQVRIDALTDLFNFRFFNETIALEMERTRRGTQPLAMILLDIDHFKHFNDKWGHELGNHALIHIANLIKLTVRKLDYPCRFGGEEFIILLPNTDLQHAVSVAERLRELIETTPLLSDESSPIAITASFGVDLFSNKMSETCEGFIKRVDAWLYQAKNKGRNVVAHPEVAVFAQNESVSLEEKDALFDILNNET